jgi:hypothetical protein
MGMKNSSDVFCHRTDDILSDVPDLIKVVDDSLLQAETEEELLSILRIALVACWKGNLTLSKCDENVRKIASDERSREEHAARTINA